jgi:hypothetical protein
MNVTGRRQKLLLVGYPVGLGLAALWLLAGLATPSIAECPLGGISPYFGDSVYLGSGYPFRASTPAESFARGAADVIRAQGEFNRQTSQAAINAQEARARAIVNAQNGVDAYFKIREMNRDYRRAERGPRPTQEDAERYAQAAQPTPLSPSELDTLTGRVRWPILLRDDRLASLRAELEELLDRWAVSRNLGQPDGFGTEQHLATRSVVRAMEDQLREDVRDRHPQDYAAAKRFLRGLESQVLRPGTSGISVAVQ